MGNRIHRSATPAILLAKRRQCFNHSLLSFDLQYLAKAIAPPQEFPVQFISTSARQHSGTHFLSLSKWRGMVQYPPQGDLLPKALFKIISDTTRRTVSRRMGLTKAFLDFRHAHKSFVNPIGIGCSTERIYAALHVAQLEVFSNEHFRTGDFGRGTIQQSTATASKSP